MNMNNLSPSTHYRTVCMRLVPLAQKPSVTPSLHQNPPILTFMNMLHVYAIHNPGDSLTHCSLATHLSARDSHIHWFWQWLAASFSLNHLHAGSFFRIYCKTSNISHTIVGNNIVDNSRCSWSIACRRCSNYIFILNLTPGFNGLSKDNYERIQETFKLWDLVRFILEVLRWIYIYPFHIILQHRNVTDCWDSFSKQKRPFSFHVVDIMAAHNLVTPTVKSSSAMALTKFSWQQYLISEQELSLIQDVLIHICISELDHHSSGNGLLSIWWQLKPMLTDHKLDPY